MKQIVITLVLALAGLTASVYSQELPSWVTKTTASGNTLTAVEHAATFEEACILSNYSILKHVSLTVEPGSLYAVLQAEDSTFTIDLYQQLAKVSLSSPSFVVKNRFVNDTATWTQMSITAANLKAFADSAKLKALNGGVFYLENGRRLLKAGDLFGAANAFAQGLNAVSCMMFKSLVPESENEDVAISLYRYYLSVLDPLRVNFLKTELPMVKGEAIPLDIKIVAKSDATPVVNFPLAVWADNETCALSAGRTTDNAGFLTCKVNAETSKLFCALDAKAFDKIPPTFAVDKFKAMLAQKAQITTVLELKSFDPIPAVYIEIPAADSATYGDALLQLVSNNGYKVASEKNKADLMMTVVENGVLSLPYAADDYKLIDYKTSLNVALSEIESAQKLLDYAVADFKIMQPAQKSEDRIRAKAIKEMLKTVTLEMPAQLKGVSYDKRAHVYGHVKNLFE